jgi:hypothetical protein
VSGERDTRSLVAAEIGAQQALKQGGDGDCLAQCQANETLDRPARSIRSGDGRIVRGVDPFPSRVERSSGTVVGRPGPLLRLTGIRTLIIELRADAPIVDQHARLADTARPSSYQSRMPSSISKLRGKIRPKRIAMR